MREKALIRRNGSTLGIKALVVQAFIVTALVLPISGHAQNDLISKKSPYDVGETIDRLQSVLESKGLTIFARVDHAAGAEKAGMEILPEQLLIFGNPKLGSPLIASQPTAGIDLPMKALSYQDADGQVWLVYNAPVMISNRHGIDDKKEIIDKMTGALDNLTNAALAQ